MQLMLTNRQLNCPQLESVDVAKSKGFCSVHAVYSLWYWNSEAHAGTSHCTVHLVCLCVRESGVGLGKSQWRQMTGESGLS